MKTKHKINILTRSENSTAILYRRCSDGYLFLLLKKKDPAIKIFAIYFLNALSFILFFFLKGTFLYITLDFSHCLFPSFCCELAFFLLSLLHNCEKHFTESQNAA